MPGCTKLGVHAGPEQGLPIGLTEEARESLGAEAANLLVTAQLLQILSCGASCPGDPEQCPNWMTRAARSERVGSSRGLAAATAPCWNWRVGWGGSKDLSEAHVSRLGRELRWQEAIAYLEDQQPNFS